MNLDQVNQTQHDIGLLELVNHLKILGVERINISLEFKSDRDNINDFTDFNNINDFNDFNESEETEVPEVPEVPEEMLSGEF